MIIGAKYKVCRRLGSGVFEKCQNQKFSLSEARHEKSNRGKRRKQVSDYGQQLIEKQKIRFSYGISEKQLGNYVKEATTIKKVTPRDALFQLLEARLDNTLYRLGIASTRRLARQMSSHGHFVVNGKRTTVPSFRLKEGDVVALREGSKSRTLFQGLDKKLAKVANPAWLSFDVKNLSAKITGVPVNTETFLDFGSVLEFYSR
ncbi:30S ribosomal protein S4 [Candidatus Parcubacteria bacterium]|nr:30S ribosomal protein S4 [Candidatus Parcubacteria bacterium]